MEDYKKKSIASGFILILMMFSLGFLVNLFQQGNSITGAVVADSYCSDNNECDDGISCTIDSCKNAGEGGSFCSHSPVDYCEGGDGCCPVGCVSSTDSDCGK